MTDAALHDDLLVEEALYPWVQGVATAAALYFGLTPEQSADFGEWLMGEILTDLDALAQEAFA